MKKYFIYLALLVAASFSGCSSLELAPIDNFGSGNFWSSKAQVNGYMIGIHSTLRSNYFNFFVLGEARGGTQKDGTSSLNTSLDNSSPVKNNAFSASTTGITSWAGFYGAILNLNLFIKKVEKECPFLSSAERSYYLGQAYGVRALYYFYLYRTFGGVPIVTEPKVMEGVNTAQSLYTARATPKETLDFIKSEIGKSEASFGSDKTVVGNKSSWSVFATLMLKAEVYLWSAKVPNGDQQPAANNADVLTAKAALQAVTGFNLVANFADVIPSKGNAEIIMALRFIDGEATNSAAQFVYSKDVFVGQVYGRDGKIIASDTLKTINNGILRNEYKYGLFTSYDAADTRRDITFLDFYSINKAGAKSNGLVLKKFMGIINSTGVRSYSDDIPLYRYAETLLMLAECENMLGGDPSPYINQVRQRAYGKSWDATLYGYVNADFATNEMAILHERDKEFVCENKRWFDVVRFQDANHKSLAFDANANYRNDGEAALNPLLSATEAYKLQWPVDVNTLNGDPLLKQTAGY